MLHKGRLPFRTGSVVAVVALAVSLFVVDAPAGASPSPINRTNSQINSLQARAQALAEEITTDQNKVSTAAEQYDEQTVLLQQDQASLAKACEGIEVVVSTVQGGAEVIIEGQRNLLAAAEAARVKRMIPSVFSVDLTQLDFLDNVNLDLRKTFDESFASSKVAPTSVYCGGFLDVALSPHFPLVDWEKGVIRYWGDGNQPLDYTAVQDVGSYAAAAVTDSGLNGKPLRVAGNSLTMKEMHRSLEKASGRSLEARSLGTVEELHLLIDEKKRTATNPWDWISLQYTWCMVSGKGKLRNLDNARYPQIRPVSVESFVRSMLPNLPRG